MNVYGEMDFEMDMEMDMELEMRPPLSRFQLTIVAKRLVALYVGGGIGEQPTWIYYSTIL